MSISIKVDKSTLVFDLSCDLSSNISHLIFLNININNRHFSIDLVSCSMLIKCTTYDIALPTQKKLCKLNKINKQFISFRYV